MIHIALALAELRAKIEKETDQRIYDIDLNAGFFLNDICQAIGLNADQRQLVLGGRQVDQMLESPVELKPRRVPRMSRVTRVRGARVLHADR